METKLLNPHIRSHQQPSIVFVSTLMILIASSLASAGCGEHPALMGGDGGGGAAGSMAVGVGGASGGGAGSGAGMTGAGGPAAACPPLEYLFPPRTFREPRGEFLPQSRIDSVVADQAHVYFLESARVFRAPAASGEPELIEDSSDELFGIGNLWLYKDQLLLSADSGLETMAVTGGARTKLVRVAIGSSVLTNQAQVEGDLLFRGENGFGGSGSGVRKVDLANKTSTLLSTGSNVVGDGVALVGNQFLVGLGPDSLLGPAKLHTLSLDGKTIEPFVPEISRVPRIADEVYVYFSGNPDRYRMPVAGGSLEKIPEGPSLRLVARATGGLVSNGPALSADLVKLKATIWFLPWQGAPVLLGCVDGMKTTSVDWVAAAGRTAYAAIGFADKTATIARFRLP